MNKAQLYQLSYDEIERYYSDKERQYLPVFLRQDKDLYSFLSDQSDPDLKDEEILGTLFVRLSLSNQVRVTDELATYGGRDYAIILPKV